MEIKIPVVPPKKEDVTDIIDKQVATTTDVKSAIDLLATRTALEQGDTVEKIVTEKSNELKNDAEKRRLEAETKKIEEQVKQIKAEKEKQIEELDKTIATKQKQVEELKADSDKAQEYFNQNKEILKYIGIRSAKTLKVMQFWLYPASLIFAIVQILLLPLTFIGVVIEAVINIVGSICGELKSNGLKIIIATIVVVLLVAILVLVYVFGGKLIANV